MIRCWKISVSLKSVCVCWGGGVKFWPNNNRYGGNHQVYITAERWEIYMGLLHTNRKSYMASAKNCTITFYIECPRKIKFQSLRFGRLICRERVKSGYTVPDNTNRKSYMGSSMAPSHLRLSDPESSQPLPISFWSLISRKTAALDNLLLLNTNRKLFVGRPNCIIGFNVEGPWKVKVRSLRVWMLVHVSCEEDELGQVLLLYTLLWNHIRES